MSQGRDTCTTKVSREKHGLPRSTHPPIAPKSCSAARTYSAQGFSAQRDPAKMTVCCRTQELAVFGGDRGDLWAAAPYPEMPAAPLPACCAWDCPSPCSSPWRETPGVQHPRGVSCLALPGGSPIYLAGVSTQVTPLPEQAAGRAEPVWASPQFLPFSGMGWADLPPRTELTGMTSLT